MYVLDKIKATYNNTGELEEISTSHALNNQVVEEEQEATDSEPEVQDKNVVETYQLYYCHFAHLGLAKIGAIHKITTHAKPVKVAKCECETCQETKMVKRRGKVADRAEAPLERVSIDTCSPFPVSREGYTQALVVKDNYTWMSWMILIKD